MDPGSSLAADNFFSCFFTLPHLRKAELSKNSAFAEDGAFVLPKKAPLFFKHLLHKLQIR